MKKFFYVLLAFVALTSCRKDPDQGQLSWDFLVYTNYDQTANFRQFTNYYMPDSILVIDQSLNPQYWKGAQAAPILDTYVKNMTAYGYTRQTDKAMADVGLQITYVLDVSYFTKPWPTPYWWQAYPAYWSPEYWGNWGEWYYPYPVVYTYAVGSLLTEMVNLKPAGGTTALPVVWNCFMSGLLSRSSNFNMQLAVRAIDQSFVQSPYLNNLPR